MGRQRQRDLDEMSAWANLVQPPCPPPHPTPPLPVPVRNQVHTCRCVCAPRSPRAPVCFPSVCLPGPCARLLPDATIVFGAGVPGEASLASCSLDTASRPSSTRRGEVGRPAGHLFISGPAPLNTRMGEALYVVVKGPHSIYFHFGLQLACV